jgi:hypothetical protein
MDLAGGQRRPGGVKKGERYANHPAWAYSHVGFLSGACSGGLRDLNAERGWVDASVVWRRAVTSSPSTGLEVFAPGRPDMFLRPEPQGTLILPVRSANLTVAPLAVV